MRLLVTMKLGDTIKLKNGMKGFLGLIEDHIFIDTVYRSFVLIEKNKFKKVSFSDVSWSTVGLKKVLTEKINIHINDLCSEGKIEQTDKKRIL